MRELRKKIAFVLLLITLFALMLTGCHGSRGLDPFVIPEEFDTAREYEITFWAKNDTNITLGSFYSIETPVIDIRCDLHPRWSRNNKIITFDSTHERFRGIYMVNWENYNGN